MASHPWGAQRLLAYVTLSGMFDRYPNLRIGFAECSAGWLGGWLNRMTYQADYLAARLPGTKRTPIEYALDGRIFCGVELDEGPDVVKGVAAIVGDGVLMYSSDYPHGGCRFPSSVDIALLVARAARRGHLRQARQRERPPLPEDVSTAMTKQLVKFSVTLLDESQAGAHEAWCGGCVSWRRRSTASASGATPHDGLTYWGFVVFELAPQPPSRGRATRRHGRSTSSARTPSTRSSTPQVFALDRENHWYRDSRAGACPTDPHG